MATKQRREQFKREATGRKATKDLEAQNTYDDDGGGGA